MPPVEEPTPLEIVEEIEMEVVEPAAKEENLTPTVEVQAQAPVSPADQPVAVPAPVEETTSNEIKVESPVKFLGRNTGPRPYYYVRVDIALGEVTGAMVGKYPLKDFAVLVEFSGAKPSDADRVKTLETIGKYLVDQGGSAALEVRDGASTVFATTKPGQYAMGQQFGVPALPPSAQS